MLQRSKFFFFLLSEAINSRWRIRKESLKFVVPKFPVELDNCCFDNCCWRSSFWHVISSLTLVSTPTFPLFNVGNVRVTKFVLCAFTRVSTLNE